MAQEFLSRSFWLEKLVLKGTERSENMDFYIYTAIQNCPNVVHIEILDSNISNDCFDTMLEAYEDLTTLVLISTCLQNDVGKIAHLRKLRNLTLSGYHYKFTSEDLILLAQNCGHLQSLKMERVRIFTEIFRNLGKNVSFHFRF